MKNPKIIDFIVFILILLFAYSSLSKVIEYDVFQGALSKSSILKPMASALSIAIPVSEIITCLLLATPRFFKAGLHASLLLMSIFTAYVIYILTFSKRLPCSCGGVIQKMTWHQHLYFNLAFLLISFTGVLLARQPDLDYRKAFISLKKRQ